MSFLFNHNTSKAAPFSISDNASTDILVGPQLWQSLSSGNDALYLALRPTRSRKYPSLICRAVLNTETEGLSVPSKYKHFLADSASVHISVTNPVVLDEVVLIATTSDAYEAAHKDDSLFDAWFDDHRIIRQGESLSATSTLTSDGLPALHSFTVEITEPVLQGRLEKGTTRFVLLCEDESADSVPPSETDEEFNDIEIDSNFLASSALSKPLRTRSSSHPDITYDQDGQSSFTCISLSDVVSRVDDDLTLYLRTSDLGKLGILNSDWAVVGNSASQYRLARVVVNDTLVESSGQVQTSPILFFNISQKDASDFTESSSTVQLLPSPFGSHRPFIPTAKAITVARIASPFSINKQQQEGFLGGLKTYFEDTQRLVKQGDVIAVPIDATRPRWSQDAEDSGLHDRGHIPLDESLHKHELVFFMITNIEYDVLASPSDSTRSSPQPYHDLYLDGRMGELGCWVDPSATRIVQAGLEHSRIPDVGSYFDPERRTPGGTLQILSHRNSPLLHPSSTFGKLLSAVSASMTKWALDCSLDLTFLLKGQSGIGKFTTLSWVAQRLGIHVMELDCYDLIGENDTKTEGTLRVRFEQAAQCSPCILVLRKLEAFAQSTQQSQGKESPLSPVLTECISNLRNSWKASGSPVILVGTVTEAGQVPPSILAQFKHEFQFEVPDERSRFEILSALLHSSTLSSDVSLSHLATQTAALVAADLVDLVSRAHTLSLERTMRTQTADKRAVQLSGLSLSAADFDAALGKARDAYSESIGAPKIPSVTWDDVGGLAHVKADILDTIQLPLERPELFADGLKKRSGILLYGPPGTGKTLIAKAVATSCSLNFFSVKGPELLNMYIGESEANVRRVFQKARDAKPCVIFFDELDSVAPKRGNHGDSGGVMDRIVSQLLAELDGMSGGEGGDVFVIGATNRPDLLDPALLRPGRFDRMLYLGVSDTHEKQFNILEALTRKFRLDPDLDLRQVAESCPFNYTGADFYALCSDAMLNAMSRKAMSIDNRIKSITEEELAEMSASSGIKHPFPLTPQYYLSELATPDEIRVTVTAADFRTALDSLVPSVSEAEMGHYAAVQKRFTQDKPGA